MIVVYNSKQYFVKISKQNKIRYFHDLKFRTKKSHLKKWLINSLKKLNEYYFLILPSPNMIHRAEKGELSSSINAYLGSIFLMRPDSH